ncbi:MAG: SDR family oxidoreductase [Actinomycetia bacterium]|nr:SDR family oxidoreductase [Actinomycetes bacterium]
MDLTERLAGRRVLVTGGGTGIGRATCVRLAEEGAAVAVTDVRPEEAAETVRLVEAAGGSATAYELDVTDESATQRVLAEASEMMGGLDGLFANAGITTGGRIQELTLDDWHRVIAVNLTGPFLSIKHALPYLIESGGGAIVATGSVSSVVNGLGGGAVSYKASKGGVLQIIRVVATEHADDGVRANCVCPGFVATKIVDHAIETADATTTPRSEHRPSSRVRPPISRAGDPSEIASVVAFLLSEDASFMTGSAVMADGGYTSI